MYQSQRVETKKLLKILSDIVNQSVNRFSVNDESNETKRVNNR